MDTFRRRSHKSDDRAAALTALLIRILEQYRDDVEVHDCGSCMVNVEIFEREAQELRVPLDQEARP